MKKLLTIAMILIGVSGLGQTNDSIPKTRAYLFGTGTNGNIIRSVSDTVRLWVPPLRTDLYFEGNKIGSIPSNLNSVPVLAMMLLYADECYNDSTLRSVAIKHESGSHYYDTLAYTSKQPTFAGFIEWFKEKQKPPLPPLTEAQKDKLGFANYCLELHIIIPTSKDLEWYEKQGGWEYYSKHIVDAENDLKEGKK